MIDVNLGLPQYELTIPSNGNKITVRPFLVKEEKLLLMALESGDNVEIINTTKQVINACILSGETVDSLPFFDVDYLFIALRAKSVGDSVEIKFTCKNKTDKGICGNVFPASIDVANCKVRKQKKSEFDIILTPTVSIKMRYPNYHTMKVASLESNPLTSKIAIIAGSIDHIRDGDKVFSHKDVTPEDMIGFVESLKQDQFSKLEDFVNSFPSFVVTAEAKCDKCGFDHRLEYDNFESFFE